MFVIRFDRDMPGRDLTVVSGSVAKDQPFSRPGVRSKDLVGQHTAIREVDPTFLFALSEIRGRHPGPRGLDPEVAERRTLGRTVDVAKEARQDAAIAHQLKLSIAKNLAAVGSETEYSDQRAAAGTTVIARPRIGGRIVNSPVGVSAWQT